MWAGWVKTTKRDVVLEIETCSAKLIEFSDLNGECLIKIMKNGWVNYVKNEFPACYRCFFIHGFHMINCTDNTGFPRTPLLGCDWQRLSLQEHLCVQSYGWQFTLEKFLLAVCSNDDGGYRSRWSKNCLQGKWSLVYWYYTSEIACSRKPITTRWLTL